MTLSEIQKFLEDRGIFLRSVHEGPHKQKCPACTASRKKPGDKSLYVRIESGKAMWKCFNPGCGFKGSTGQAPDEAPKIEGTWSERLAAKRKARDEAAKKWKRDKVAKFY